MRVIADFETRSGVSIRNVTPHRYATDPEADILCLTYGLKKAPPTAWYPGQEVPQVIELWVLKGYVFVFHNAEFDWHIWNEIAVPRYGFPFLPREQVDCTAARAAAVHLPRGLAHLGMALGLEEQKLADMGHDVLMRPGISIPRKPTKADPRRWYTPADKPDEFEKLERYALQDIRATDHLDDKVKPLQALEWRVFHTNMAVNARGIKVDVPLIHRSLELLDYETKNLIGRQLEEATDGYVKKLTQIPTIKKWLAHEGIDVKSLSESARNELLEDDDLSIEVRLVIELLDANRATVRKLPAMLRTMSADGRIRGLFRYCGASQTMRFSGEKVQPQNLARPEQELVDQVFDIREHLTRYGPEMLTLMYGSVSRAVSNAIRTFFMAEDDYSLVAVDLAQIEVRVLAWLAGDLEMLHILETGDDPYRRMGAVVYDLPLEQVTKKSDARQLGKIIILACGYQMGPDTFQTQSKIQYNLDVSDELAERSVKAYRSERKQVTALWWKMQEAAFDAIQNPGSTYYAGKVAFRYVSKCLQMRLPSGHILYYWDARIIKAWHPIWEKEIDQITYRSIRGYNGGMRKSTYGGKLTENAVQSLARHVLAESMVRMHDNRLPLVLHAHDEAVSEVKTTRAQQAYDYMIKEMTTRPKWAPDLPLEAEGWIGRYYRK